MILKVITAFLIGTVLGNPSCPQGKDGMINVHLVCHTHDDVGWLKTTDQYYYGAEKRITWVGVQYILDSVVDSLLKDQSRKFIYVESAFFFRWWSEQSQEKKQKVKEVVNRGQLEFIGGGWCMNDEGAGHYNAIIDQMTVGLAKLNDTFGEAAVPRIAWQIDPFGHSREQASLFAQMGFDGLFLGRIDYDDKKERLRKKEMEFLWKASNSLGQEASLFTGILPNTYSPPKGFCFDLLCPDDPIMDDPRLEDYNVDQKVASFLTLVHQQSEGYATRDLIMTMGEDFNYVNAESWYKNLDKLIRYVNARQQNGSQVNLMYSTPSCYLDALQSAGITWPSKTDDFFPYASDPHAFWTGYFTSRPTFKGFIRQANNILQIVKQLWVLSGRTRDDVLQNFAETIGVVQHHDAVSGTAKQHVTNDYYLQLARGMEEALQGLKYSLRAFVNKGNNSAPVSHLQFCPQLNISACPFTETSSNFLVTIYNPLSKSINYYIRIPVAKDSAYKITDSNGNALKVQLVPLSEAVLRIPGRTSLAKYEVVFLAEDVPALGVSQFWVQKSTSLVTKKEQKSYKFTYTGDKDMELETNSIRIKLDQRSGGISAIGLPGHNPDIKISAKWMWYAGMAGDNKEFDRRASGAYIFRNNGTAKPVSNRPTPSIQVTGGDLVVEVEQQWEPWLVQTSKIYRDQKYVENDWLVGPIPINDGVGKEIICRYELDMDTNSTFYTDSNGREMIKRERDFRPTWALNKTEPVSENYYPVNTRILLKDKDSSGGFAVMTDRSQGGSSLSDGALELMVHRRLLHDDAFGVDEPLNETAFGEGLVVRGKHYLLHSSLASDDCDFACQHRTLGEQLLLQPILSFSPAPEMSGSWKKKHLTKKSGLSFDLPLNVHLLTLEPWTYDRILLRLEHMYESGESTVFSTPVTVDLKNMFSDWEVTEMKEVTLGGNRWKSDLKPLKWHTRDDKEDVNNNPYDNMHGNFLLKSTVIILNPMQIRSFLIKLSPKGTK